MNNNNRVFYIENRNVVHKLTFGLPGSGISFVMEKEITTVANNTKDDNIVIIDACGGQFNEVIKNFGGVVITTKELLECFDKIVFGSLETLDNESYNESFDIVVTFLEDLGLDYIHPYQQSILYKVLDDMRKSSEPNTFSNLIQRLQKKDSRMASTLEILNTFPNFENNQDIVNKLSNRFVCFDLGNCPENFKSLVYLLALKMTKGKMWKNENKQIYTCLFTQIDHTILTKGLCNYLSDFYKRMRQHWGLTSFYADKFSTFANNQTLVRLLNNTNEFIFLKQNPCDINKLPLCFDIPDKYLHFLTDVSAGHGIWTDGTQWDFIDYNEDFLLGEKNR